MKAFLIDFHTPMFIDVAKRLAKESIEIGYWTGHKKYFDRFVATEAKESFPNVIFHNIYDAVKAVPAQGIDIGNLEPLNKDIIDRMLPCESQVLTMMNSIDYDNMPFSQKKHVYYEYLKYWHGVLEKFKPEVIFFANVPHVSFNFVIYSLAKVLKIKTVMCSGRPRGIQDRMIFFDDVKKYGSLLEEIEKVKDEQVELKDLSRDMGDFYRKYTESSSGVKHFFLDKEYMKKKTRPYRLGPSFSSIPKHLKNFTFLKAIYLYLKMFFFQTGRFVCLEKQEYRGLNLRWKYYQWEKIKKNFKREYLSLQIEKVDFSKKYIYVPLHNQPEASTSALGDVFVDQLLMLDIISASLPKDWAIYVKESPLQWRWPRTYLGRYNGYYRQIKKMNNVFLVPAETSTLELILHSQAVATVTGTAGLEALFKGKPALIFGHIWYMYCQGVFRVASVAECRMAIEKIVCGYSPNKKDVLRFLLALDRALTRGYINEKIFAKNSKINYEENIRNIVESYLRIAKQD